MARNYTSLSFKGATGISAQPRPNILQSAVENVTGIPLRKDYYEFESPQDIFMKTIPALVTMGLGAKLNSMGRIAGNVTKKIASFATPQTWNPPSDMIEKGGEAAYNTLRSGALRNQDDDFYNRLMTRLGGRGRIIN